MYETHTMTIETVGLIHADAALAQVDQAYIVACKRRGSPVVATRADTVHAIGADTSTGKR